MSIHSSKEDIRQWILDEIQGTVSQKNGLEELLSRKETAKILGVAENTLAVWAMQGRGPAPTKLGRRSLYRRSIINQYINDNTMPR
jgi:predicted DNA-binding transcriptional regulator AlpA